MSKHVTRICDRAMVPPNLNAILLPLHPTSSGFFATDSVLCGKLTYLLTDGLAKERTPISAFSQDWIWFCGPFHLIILLGGTARGDSPGWMGAQSVAFPVAKQDDPVLVRSASMGLE